MEIQKGDVVKLKSGGPLMTVKFVEDDSAYCEWFAGTKVEGSRFDVAQLNKVQ